MRLALARNPAAAFLLTPAPGGPPPPSEPDTDSITGPEFAPALTSQLADTRALQADEAQRHHRTATALEDHLRLLQPR